MAWLGVPLGRHEGRPGVRRTRLEEGRHSRGRRDLRGDRGEGHNRVAAGRRVAGHAGELVRTVAVVMERDSLLEVEEREHRSDPVHVEVGEADRSLAEEGSGLVEEEHRREGHRRVVEGRGVAGDDLEGDSPVEEDMRHMEALLQVSTYCPI